MIPLDPPCADQTPAHSPKPTPQLSAPPVRQSAETRRGTRVVAELPEINAVNHKQEVQMATFLQRMERNEEIREAQEKRLVDLNARIAELEAENTRLREALESAQEDFNTITDNAPEWTTNRVRTHAQECLIKIGYTLSGK